MNPKEFIETPDQVGYAGRKQATGCVTNLRHEVQQALTADSPTSRALWRLSLVLREISKNSEPHGDEKQAPHLILAKDGDGGYNVEKTEFT